MVHQSHMDNTISKVKNEVYILNDICDIYLSIILGNKRHG